MLSGLWQLPKGGRRHKLAVSEAARKPKACLRLALLSLLQAQGLSAGEVPVQAWWCTGLKCQKRVLSDDSLHIMV